MSSVCPQQSLRRHSSGGIRGHSRSSKGPVLRWSYERYESTLLYVSVLEEAVGIIEGVWMRDICGVRLWIFEGVWTSQCFSVG